MRRRIRRSRRARGNERGGGESERVEDHSGGELGEEVGALVGHDLAFFAKVFDRHEGGGLEEEADLIAVAVNLGGDLMGVGGVVFSGFLARGEDTADDLIEQVSLEDRDVESSPGVAPGRLKGLEDVGVFEVELVEFSCLAIEEAEGVWRELGQDAVGEFGDAIRAKGHGGDVEGIADGGGEDVDVEVFQAADQAVGGEDEKAGVLDADEDEEAPVGGMVFGEGSAAGGADLLLVVESGGVAVVAIGDVDGLGAQDVDDLVFDFGV